jgi:hypothetical protein
MRSTPTARRPRLAAHQQVVREGSRRVLGLRPFDVQLIGGMILHEGQVRAGVGWGGVGWGGVGWGGGLRPMF